MHQGVKSWDMDVCCMYYKKYLRVNIAVKITVYIITLKNLGIYMSLKNCYPLNNISIAFELHMYMTFSEGSFKMALRLSINCT